MAKSTTEPNIQFLVALDPPPRLSNVTMGVLGVGPINRDKEYPIYLRVPADLFEKDDAERRGAGREVLFLRVTASQNHYATARYETRKWVRDIGMDADGSPMGGWSHPLGINVRQAELILSIIAADLGRLVEQLYLPEPVKESDAPSMLVLGQAPGANEDGEPFQLPDYERR